MCNNDNNTNNNNNSNYMYIYNIYIYIYMQHAFSLATVWLCSTDVCFQMKHDVVDSAQHFICNVRVLTQRLDAWAMTLKPS